jgi:hypothetical protein
MCEIVLCIIFLGLFVLLTLAISVPKGRDLED